MTKASVKKILVLGVGNILLRDEGIGIRVVEKMQKKYSFSSNVSLLDGGVRGLLLMDYIAAADFLIVVDAVLGGGPPASIYRLEGDDLRLSIAFKNSVHDLDLLETLACCELATEKRPKAVIIGIEPKDYQSDPSLAISPELVEQIPDIIEKVLHEIKAAGGTYTIKEA